LPYGIFSNKKNNLGNFGVIFGVIFGVLEMEKIGIF
jgi:hypothetical protein